MRDAVLSGRNGEIEEMIKDCWPGEQSCSSDNRTSLGLRALFLTSASRHTHTQHLLKYGTN